MKVLFLQLRYSLLRKVGVLRQRAQAPNIMKKQGGFSESAQAIGCSTKKNVLWADNRTVRCKSGQPELPTMMTGQHAYRDNTQATECQHPNGRSHSPAGIQALDVHVLDGCIGPCRVSCVICTCAAMQTLSSPVAKALRSASSHCWDNLQCMDI